MVIVRSNQRKKNVIKHKLDLVLHENVRPRGALRELVDAFSTLDFSACLGLIINEGNYSVTYTDNQDLEIKFVTSEFDG